MIHHDEPLHLDCGSRTLPDRPGQLAVPGARMPLLSEVFALTNHDFLQAGQPGASPWLGGIDIDDFGGDPIAAVRSFGAVTTGGRIAET